MNITRLFLFISRWASQMGDTTFWSWVITFLYGITIIVSIYYINKLKGESNRSKRFLWICITSFTFAMGINKQLDFQIFLRLFGRGVARHQGWFEYRRIVQSYFAAGIIVSVSAAVFFILYRIRNIIRNSLIELTGVLILIVFAFIRAGSMSHIKAAISFEKNVLPHIHGLELLGLLFILSACVYHLKTLPRNIS